MIIHITGTDSYRSAQRLAELRSAFIKKHDPQGLNVVSLDGSTATVADVRNAISATGFFAKKRLVSLDRYDAAGQLDSQAIAELLEPIASTDHDVIVVIRDVRSSAKPSARSKTTKKKTSTGISAFAHEKREDFPVLSPLQTVTWIENEAVARDGAIVPAAAKRLAALCVNDSWRIASELEKLLLYVGQKPITEHEVDELVRGEVNSDIFALTDALGARQSGRAVELLHRELEAGTNAFALIASIASHVRNLYHVQRALQRGVPQHAIATELALHPFVVQKAAAQTKHFSLDELHVLHDRLLNIDHSLKTSPLDAETLLDLLMIER